MTAQGQHWLEDGYSLGARLEPSMQSVSIVLMVVCLAGCPNQADTRKPAQKTCVAFGEQCEFAPGKLGTCVIRDNCSENCYVCQSQH